DPEMTGVMGDVIIVRRYKSKQHKEKSRGQFGKLLIAAFTLNQFRKLYWYYRPGIRWGPWGYRRGFYRVPSRYYWYPKKRRYGRRPNPRFFKNFKSKNYHAPRKIDVGYLFKHKTKPITYVIFDSVTKK
ncbi:unnamed protein product, partial [marine sediment metagenome]